MRFQRTPSTRNTVKTANRQRMIFAGFCIAVALLVGITTFLLINFGRNDEAFAALGTNMGFENNMTDWSTNSGTWAANTSVFRSGAKSSATNVTSLLPSVIRNPNSALTATNGNGTKVVVMAWARGTSTTTRLRVGITSTTNTNTSMAPTYTTLSTTGWTQVSAVFTVGNNTTWTPLIEASNTSISTATVYVDDVHIYTASLSIADVTAPAAPKITSISTNNQNVTLNWTNGIDGETGIDGVTILRYTGTNATDISLNSQAAYHATLATVGPTSVSSWKVVYQGAAVTTITDATPAAGTYTYLIYMRDKAYNYTSTAVARALVVDGNSTHTTSSSTEIDGLYVGTGSTAVVSQSGTLTLRTNGVANIKGTIIHQGVIANNGTFNFKSGSTYKYDVDGGNIVTANWETGSTCEITGTKFTAPSNLTQAFHHFKWNCDQVAAQDLPSGMVINGDLNLTNSGPGASERIMWFNGNMKIRGNFYVGTYSEFKCRPGNYIEFDGTSEQTIQVIGSTCRFNAFEVDNSNNVKMLCNATLDSLCRLSIGQLKMNGYTFYHENNATIVKALGKLSTGLLTPVSSTYKYNLVYERGDDTDEELTTSTNYLNDLTINIPSAEIVKLKRIAYVNGKLYLVNGKVQTDGKEVYVRNTTPSSISYSSSSYVYGNLRRNIGTLGTYAFPVGTLTNQQCAVLELNNLTGVSSVLAFFKNTINGSAPSVWVNGVLINTILNGGFWTVTPNVQPTGGTYDITLHERGYTNPVSSTTNSTNNQYYTVLKRDNSTTAWVHQGQTIGMTQQVGGGTVSVPNKSLTSFSDFAIAYGNTVLPITLSAFNATLQSDETVRITWSTSAEINNAYFSLERSVNGTDFEIINEQEGAGNSTTLLNYSFTDLHPVSGTNYYRLKQVDFDGTFTYGPIRQVTLTGTTTNGGLSANEIGVFPNPSTGVFTFTNKNNTEITGLTVTDIKGQVIKQQSIERGAQMQIDLTTQPIGIYIVTFTDAEKHSVSHRIVVSR